MKVSEKAQYKIAISGASETSHCGPNIHELSEQIGREIVKQGGVVITGATTGAPYWAAKGAKEEGGLSIGFSPAASEKEHLKVYRLPTDYFDVIVYTGFNYSGRNLILMRAADAVIVACGRMGTLNEFTIAFEDKKPIGILEGPWATDETIKEMVEQAHRGPGKIVYDPDPKSLVQKVIKLIEEERSS
ncbi:hypothetical protein C4553_00400 [Candidatus Parcubacteria bacterium]|nr:MAG: hypothetical protein C4553_00400 [Candidatus Parcubacteria bacterium]